MGYRRHIVINVPSGDTQVHVFDYDNTVAICMGISPEVFTSNDGKAIKGMINAFVTSLLASGYEIISDKSA